MNPLANHLWQSALFAAAAGLSTLAFRKNRARLRYWLWLTASLKFLVPFSVLIALAGQIHWRGPQPPAPSNIAVVMDEVSEPFTVVPSPMAFAASPGGSALPAILAAVWACGFIGIACSWTVRWLRIRMAVRAAQPVSLDLPIPALMSPTLLEPGVFGVFRPVLLLPEGILQRLTPVQFGAVVEHELCHVRHRDNLGAGIHMFVETVFWFHPLVWWIGKRLVEERERACDEEVLARVNDPRVYAEAILNICKLYAESPLACVAGVTGSDLKNRIEVIMRNRIVRRLNLPKKLAIAVAGIAAVATPVVVGVMNLPAMRAQSAPAPTPVTTGVEVDPPAIQVVPKPAARLMARQSAVRAAPAPRPQPAPTPAFEVASIKPCADSGGGTAKGGRGGGGDGQGPSPDRLNLSCRPVRTMIRLAYVDFENARRSFPLPNIPIEGGPSWLDSERYQVIAKAEGTPGQDMMRGPMLRALLEDRLKLKVHRESREVPAYLLVTGKNGPKLQPAKEGSCVAFEVFSLAPPSPGDKFPPICSVRMMRRSAPSVTWEVHGGTLDDLAHALGIDLDRIVINKTGIAGKFDFRMEFAPDESTAGLNRLRTADGPLVTPAAASDPPGGPSVFTAIQEQMGLKLEAGKGPREFLVVDRAERPSEN
jgi:bla regulator protein blaR1